MFCFYEKIKDKKLRVISPEGKNLGILDKEEALAIAQEKNLDLVVVSTSASPSIAKILDFGKFIYQKKKKRTEEKKRTKSKEAKILRIGPHIDKNDLKIKIERAEEFFENEHPVKFELLFKGREIAHPEIGREKLEKIKEELAEKARIEKDIERKGRFMNMTLAPK
ncbi:MAG: translation initiation factor IF-3 [Patescibacteria group bacterium]|nr:translation initiation factor IF-3 [Patescibacteria group bacterium]